MAVKIYKKTIEGQERAERALAREKRAADKKTRDNFMNFNLQLGQGTDNALSNSTYGFNPITRYRVLLEWIHRGSWLGGIAIDVAAEDAVRGGIEIHSSLPPKDVAKLQNALVRLGVWKKYTDLKKWGRLYGGAIAVYLIDGQRLDTPLNLETIGKGQFKGLAVFDRWQCQPTLNADGLVEEYGPDLGLPKYYIINGDAPMLRGKKIHYTRVIRQIGIELPFYQQILEQYWGISVLERLYDRLVAFDSATSGVAQYIHKMHLRVIKIDKYRQIQAAGGKLLQGFMRFAEDMRRRQSNEGITYIDTSDDFIVHNSNISSGISEALMQLGQQLSGALQMPLVRLFGQSPGGLGSNGDSELRTYYEGVNQHQERDDRVPITKICVLTAKSEGIKLDESEFGFNFRSLYQLDDQEKSAVFDKDSRAIFEAFATGLIDKPTALKELRELGRFTGRWTNITDKEIKEAENEPPQPALEDLTPKLSKLEKAGEKAAPKALAKPSGGEKNKSADNISRALASLKRMARVIRDETPVMQLFGLPVVIECNKGEKRWEGGPDWPSQYGFICNALATDGDELDCFVGDDLTAQDVFVLNHDDRNGDFEELKIMLGFGSIEEALDVYRRAYDRDAEDYSLTINLKDFNYWMARADLTKPVRARRGAAQDKDWEEQKHPRKSTGEFTVKGGGESSGGKTKKAAKSSAKPKEPAKPKVKAPVKAQLYAKVVELGLEKGQTGKYKKATNAKLLALIAGTKGWKPANPAALKGLNPFINVSELKELKKIVGSAGFAEVGAAKEQVKAAAKKPKAEKPKAETAKTEAQVLSALKLKAKKLGLKIDYVQTKEELEHQIAQFLKTETYGKNGAKPRPFNPKAPTPQQQAALSAYTNGLYSGLNKNLRQPGAKISSQYAKTVHYLDEVLNDSSYDGDLFRGVSMATFEKLSAQTDGFKIGATFGDAGFGSFSKSEKFAKNWKPRLIRVIGGGEGCADIAALSQHMHEEEVLAARGLQMKIISVDAQKGSIDVKIVGVKKPDTGTQDALDAAEAEAYEPGPQTPLNERWDLDDEDENFMMG